MVTNPGRSWFSVPSPYTVQEPIDGRTNVMLPVWVKIVACGCAGESVCMPLSRHSSSACSRKCGNASEISSPLSPPGW